FPYSNVKQPSVIASAAKQSRAEPNALDCFVASLLAMTRRIMTSRSRGAFAPESLQNTRPRKEREGAGNAGCLAAPTALCALVESTQVVTADEAEQPTFPARWC